MSLYVNRQTIEDKDKRQNVVVILETSKRRFIVCIDLKEKGYAVVLGGCPYKPLYKPKWKFFSILILISLAIPCYLSSVLRRSYMY